MRTISSDVVSENPRWQYKQDKYKLADGSSEDYFYIRTDGDVMVIPVLEDGRLALVRQYRYLPDKQSLEFPGGGIGKNEKPIDSARRELLEECGLQTDELIRIGEYEGLIGTCRCRTHLYVANGAAKVGEIKPERTEELEVFFRRPDEFNEMVKNGEILCGRTLAAWAIARDNLMAVEPENLVKPIV